MFSPEWMKRTFEGMINFALGSVPGGLKLRDPKYFSRESNPKAMIEELSLILKKLGAYEFINDEKFNTKAIQWLEL